MGCNRVDKIKNTFFIAIIGMLIIAASTPVFINSSWATDTDTVYVEFTPSGNVSIDASGYHNFSTLYAGQTKETSGSTFTYTNDGEVTLSQVDIQMTSNTGTLTAVDSSPASDQFAIQAEGGSLGTWTGIVTERQIHATLNPSANGNFDIRVILGTLSTASPGAVNCTITLTGTGAT